MLHRHALNVLNYEDDMITETTLYLQSVATRDSLLVPCKLIGNQ